jgi:threonine synthase
MPAGSDEVKVSEAASLGAKVVRVDGTYDRAKQEALCFSRERGIYYDHGGRSVHNRESMKTIAFEIAEQLGWRAPDWYVQPVSGGIGPLGVWQGFKDLKKMALVEKIPQIACVQSRECAPMALAFEKGLAAAPAVVPATGISALATGDPGFAYTLLRRRLKRTGGVITSVPDARALEVMEELGASEGQKMSPAAAVGFAGLLDLIDRGVIGRRSVVVVNCTGGGGGKVLEVGHAATPPPPVIEE